MEEKRGIWYREGYKYQLAAHYRCKVDIYPDKDIITEFIDLTHEGDLLIKAGYAWDGPSGITLDTEDSMIGALVHDSLYQLMRQKYLDIDKWREQADIELRDACVRDGMWKTRAWVWYRMVRRWAEYAAEKPKEIHFIAEGGQDG